MDELFLEYFLAYELLFLIQNYLPLPFLYSKEIKVRDTKQESMIIKTINEKTEKLKFDKKLFKRLMASHMKSLIEGKEPTKRLENFVSSYMEEVKDKIRDIPNSLDKTYSAIKALVQVETYYQIDQLYDVLVLLGDDVPKEIVEKIVRNWKNEARRYKEEHKEERHNLYFPESEIFWVSKDFMDSIDAISRYRFIEHFNIGEFEPAFYSVEHMLEESILEGSTSAEFLPAAFNLWLISRSRNLQNRIRDAINITLNRIGGSQSPEGWWTNYRLMEFVGKDPKTRLRAYAFLPDAYGTALCSLDLLKLSVSETLRQKGILGAKWLLENQNSDGSWSIWKKSKKRKNDANFLPDLFTTLLSLETIIRSGIKNVDHSIKLGIDWMMHQQNEFGLWEDDLLPFPFMTVLVLEFLQSNDYYSKQLDQYLTMSKGFLNRSVQFSLEDNSNSYRLAIITAFQGIEAFLYSVLTHLNDKIFESKDETIGMRKALTKFQSDLQNSGIIKRDQVVSFRNSLDRLAYLRDQVVHKAIDITQGECRTLIDDALRFVSEYSLKIYGFDIFA